MARSSTLARFEISGEILGEDVISQLAGEKCKLPGGEREEKDLVVSWQLLSEEWQLHRSHLKEYGTERLRRRWIVPFLETLGFSLEYQKAHIQFGDKRTIPISHRGSGIPIWILDYDELPDDKVVTGRRNQSPHELFQDYLDATESDAWGIICNGRTIRLLHDYHKTLTRNYVEVDLESVFESLDLDAFRALWRIFHAKGFQPGKEGRRPIELLRDYSRQEGAEIGRELRFSVLEALKTLGNGFLAADRQGRLLEILRADSEGLAMFYQALLRIVYRLLFLLYIENKPGWTPAINPVWASSYSIARLREQAEELSATRGDAEDHWEGLKVVFGMIRDGNEFFDIHPYGGELFDDERLGPLKGAPLGNADLLRAIRQLTTFMRNKQPYRVNFRHLRIEALGSVYEALLDLAPVLTENGLFDFGEGTDRKLSGSYYTPASLVNELIQSALVPVIADRLKDKQNKEDREAALLSITVVDPACGSGHFLLQALDTLAAKLCEIRMEGEEPDEKTIRAARRDVVTHCIHGVDLRPMAVELCKFQLWLQVAHPELPLSYLEPAIRCGNALVGVPLTRQAEAAEATIRAEREALEQAGEIKKAAKLVYTGWRPAQPILPDEALAPVGEDDKQRAAKARAENSVFVQTGQRTLSAEDAALDAAHSRQHARAEAYRPLRDSETSREAIRRKQERFLAYRRSAEYAEEKLVADLWTAAFFWRHSADDEAEVPTTEWLQRAGANPNVVPPTMAAEADRIIELVRPFHWELEFPDVFEAGGFDGILGNPPWERIKLQEQEFFASRAPQIAKAANKAARQRMIDQLRTENPDLYGAFHLAKHAAEAESKFVRKAGRFPLTAVGDVNTYALFSETARTLVSPRGRAGIIVPTGIATDDTTKVFFGSLVETGTLESYFGFKNERFLFLKPVEHTVTFGLLTMLGVGMEAKQMEFTWLCYTIEELHDPARRIVLTRDDIERANPNTRTCPVFRTRADADLTKDIYSRVPVLWNERTHQNPWGIRFQRMLDMANDSGLFRNSIPVAEDLGGGSDSGMGEVSAPPEATIPADDSSVVTTEVWSVGYGNRSRDEFFRLLERYEITHLVDVRTMPYSRRMPDFNREELERQAARYGIRYLHMGEELGGRPSDPSCYDSQGHVVYQLVEQAHFFRRGITKLLKAAEHSDRRVCMMCSELKPQDCHRTKLIGQHLWQKGVALRHISESGALLEQAEVMRRIMGDQEDLFGGDLRSRKSYRK
ncbi:DUF488 family protein [Armatimonas rosea]|uniref:site-specific DNA-methyltransferase (adenine-specific) n=1 Tax=Armatimonas rosea TaxID=685828 RepID=A0A7W9SW14_ARMRO|nr:DUF488 family protein [Armatimonas rosea]MBB6053902.1 hypothetical protein [Armatimonas rosea]